MQEDLLASLLEMPGETIQGGDDGLGAIGGTFNLDPLLNFPTSPVNSEGYSTESSSTGHLNGARSPAASIPSVGGSALDQQSLGGSPSHSPMMSSFNNVGMMSDPSQWVVSDICSEGDPYQNNGLEGMLGTSSEVTIDVGKSLTYT